MTDEPSFVVTLDVDWAPDWVIEAVAGQLERTEVKATWFVTHQSPAIDRLRQRPGLFELGIHPNFLPGSTHGSSEDEVFGHMLQLVPGAVTMRTHALYQSTPMLVKAATQYGIAVDASLFLPNAAFLRPHQLQWRGMTLHRVPYFWEDDHELEEGVWQLSHPKFHNPGLKVFDFHPIHLALNTVSFNTYEKLKAVRRLSEWTPEDVAAVAHSGEGPQTLFTSLLAAMRGRSRWITEVVFGEHARS